MTKALNSKYLILIILYLNTLQTQINNFSTFCTIIVDCSSHVRANHKANLNIIYLFYLFKKQ